MNSTKNIIKILLLSQCLLLFCTCEKEVVTTEQNRLNLAAFVTCPFNEKFDDKTDLEKYVLKKFGKPNNVWKYREKLGIHREPPDAPIVVDRVTLEYKNKYQFDITKGINKRLQFFDSIFLGDFTDLKYGINNETTIKNMKRLFGKPKDVSEIEDVYEINYYYSHKDNIQYLYHLEIVFRKEKLDTVHVRVKFDPNRL